MYFFIALTLLLVFAFGQFLWRRRRLYCLSTAVPGPMALPFIGSAYLFRGDASAIAKQFIGLFAKHPDLSKIWLGMELYYLVTKPEYLEAILNHQGTLEKIDLYKHTEPIVGHGLISGPAKTWKRHRKMIAPCLNQKILNGYPDAVAEQCAVLLDILQKECGKGEIDHCRHLTNCALDIICDTIFGVSIHAQDGDGAYSHTFDKLMEVIFLRVFFIPYHFDLLFRHTREHQEMKRVVTIIKGITRDMIERKKEQVQHHVAADEDRKKPLLDFLVEKHLAGELSRAELEDEVNTFFLAGSDTNATSSSFILTLLGMHQEVQQKLYEEVVDILGPDRPVKLEDLPELKYTERVIKESLRIFPGAPFVARVVEEDILLDEVTIPKGANVALGYLQLHRDPKYWPDPYKFDPDRFLPERSVDRHLYSWLPFSGGPRNCIGIKYGMMVMKIVVAMVIRRFRVISSIKRIEDIEVTANIVLKPKNGFRLAFEMR